jgi:hypothetical protein
LQRNTILFHIPHWDLSIDKLEKEGQSSIRPVEMLSTMLATASLLLAAFNAVNAVPTISAVGNKFFYENGTQYFIKGKPSFHANLWMIIC